MKWLVLPIGDLDGDGDLDIFGVVGEQVSIWLNVDDLAIEGVAANDSPTPLGQTTTFSATVTAGTHVVYTWDFGDGTSDVGEVVSHTYLSIGTYTATVTATNSVSTVTATTTVLVEDEAIMGVLWPAATIALPPGPNHHLHSHRHRWFQRGVCLGLWGWANGNRGHREPCVCQPGCLHRHRHRQQ